MIVIEQADVDPGVAHVIQVRGVLAILGGACRQLQVGVFI
jgi:hypothetical protein